MRAMFAHALMVFALWVGLGWATAERARAEELPTFRVAVQAGRFSPERIEVPAGQRVKLVVSNAGRGPAEFENADLRIEKVLAPGATSFVITPPLKPGNHRFVDEFHEDDGALLLVAK